MEHTAQDNQPVEADEAPPVKRLNGEVTRQGESAFAGGTYCEVWVGQWIKPVGEGVGGEGSNVEKVSLSLADHIPLIWVFVGCIESASNIPVTKEGA